MASLGPGRGVPEEERLPWLEEPPAEPRRGGGSGRWVVLALLLLAAAGAAWAAQRWWTADAPVAGGEPEWIRAEPGPYKVRPADPGGMKVEGEGSAAYSASEGEEPQAAIDLSAVPETPVGRGATARAEPDAPASDPAVDAIQLGAFSTEAKANAAWKALAARFAFLTPLEPVILPAKAGEATVYRLRAPAGVNARVMCGRLRVAGETCLVVGG